MLAMRPVTVMMTGAGAPGAFGIIQCLKNNGERNVRIVGVDMNPNASCKDLVDAFHVIPPASSENFIDSVYEVAVAESVQVILPIVTRELMKFAEAKAKFEEAGIKVSVLDVDSLSIVNDKAALLEFCRDSGFPVPDFRIALTADEVEASLASLGCNRRPVYVKSALGNGSRGVRFVDPTRSKYDMFFNEKPDSACMTKDDIMAALREKDSIPKMVVMEALPGVEYSADAIGIAGETKYLAIRKSPVVRSSITLESTIVDEPRIKTLCENLIEKLSISGSIGFDFRADAAGYPQIMEVNPRLTATVVLNAAAGMNFPYLEVKRLLGEALPALSLSYGVSVRRRYEERYSDVNGNLFEPFKG